MSADTKGFVVEFEIASVKNSRSELQHLMKDLFAFPDHLQPSKKEFENFEGPLEGILNEFSDREAGFEAMVGFKLTELLVLMHRILPQSSLVRTQEDEIVIGFLTDLERHYKEQHQVEYYAQRAGLTPKAFSMRVVRSLGESPRILIQNRLALEAKRILGSSSLSVQQVGYLLGFDDPNYFGRFFKKSTGVTPAIFRQDVTR